MTDDNTTNLDDVFSSGPEGFLNDEDGPSRLRRFLCAITPALEAEVSSLKLVKAPPISETLDEDEEFSGADAWKADAVRKWNGLWSGNGLSIPAVFGFDCPEQLLAFERATQDVNPWTSFEELRLDASIMAEPAGDENLFEKCVLNDQLNFLGTALPDIFSGTVCIGTLGNGDSYHLELEPSKGHSRRIYFYDHEQHCFEFTFSVDLESLVFLASLCRVMDDENLVLSDDVATRCFESLYNKVAPSWHFNMDERDDDFEDLDRKTGGASFFYFWRARWIYDLLRQDVGSDVEGFFIEKINSVLPSEDLPARYDAVSKFSTTALYATWRAYLFDEPELSRYLDICHEHPARLVRDAARLIDELRDGRKTLGRISDWPKVLADFRALDLDPRRASEREAEVKAKAEALQRERATIGEELVSLEGEAELRFVVERLDRPELHGAIFATLLADPSRVRAKRGIEFLLNREYSRDGSSFQHEEDDACRHIAKHADEALMALIFGMTLFQVESEEDEQKLLHWRNCYRIVSDAPQKVSSGARRVYRDVLQTFDTSERPGWKGMTLAKLAGKLRDAESASLLANWLTKLPSAGGFETAMHYDDFIGAIAVSIREIDDADAAEHLVRFALSSSKRMRDARVESALTIAIVTPELFSNEMAEIAIDLMSQINSVSENAKALIAIKKALPDFPGIENAEPMARSSAEVKFAKAFAEDKSEEANAELDKVFTESRYDDSGTIQRRRFGLLVHELFGILPDKQIVASAMGLDPDLDIALEKLCGMKAPRRLTWFEVEDMDTDQLSAAIEDPTLRGRSHAARLAFGKDRCRPALEKAVESVMTDNFDRYLLREAVKSLVALPENASTVALFDRLLKSKNRDLKDPVLRHLPAWKDLQTGMEFVRDEKWGWQESAANRWLEANS